MNDLTKYNKIESVLHLIHNQYVALSEYEIRRNKIILDYVIVSIIYNMRQKDKLFNLLYTGVAFGGSYYDDLKIGSPNEYDIDLLLIFPDEQPEIIASTKPGFVHISLKNKIVLEKLCELGSSYLDTNKVLLWMKEVFQMALNCSISDTWYPLTHLKPDEVFYIKICNRGPAFTLMIKGQYEGRNVNIDVDLVPCFLLNGEKWPINGFRQNLYPDLSYFFTLPKPPKLTPQHASRYWSLSFQDQERVLINGKGQLKPAIKLLKKLRDTMQHPIPSYYIKTVALWEANKKPLTFWTTNSLSYIFMHLLKTYKDYLSNRNIPYFWNKNYNLLEDFERDTLCIINIELANMLTDIEWNGVVAKYLLTHEEMNGLFVLVDSPPVSSEHHRI